MGKVIGIIAIKGGVGKTTVASSLAADLANNHSKNVLLVDANYSAPNLGLHMDIVSPEKTIHHVLDGKARIQSAIHRKFGVDVIPGSYSYNKNINPLKLKDRLHSLKDHYDFVIVDGSPSLNDEILSTMLASDLLFVVSTPDYPTLSCSIRAAQIARQRGKPISGVILNKIRDPKYELDIKDIEVSTAIPVVAKIPDEKVHVRALYSKMPVSLYTRKSAFSKEIGELSRVLLCQKKKAGLLKKILPINFKTEEVNRELLKEQFYKSQFTN